MDLTLKELKSNLKYIISNNERLEAKGITPISVNICSEAGYGKSAIVEEVAKELNANFVKLSLAQISETGDLCGYPVCLHYACKEDGSDCRGIVPELIDSYVKSGYRLTGETKMSYALPEGYQSIDTERVTILLLDDFSRSLPNIIQACYELIYKHEFGSFKLPPRTTIVLTTNPIGDYNVNDEDEAARTRRVNFHIKGDVTSWSEWAERNELENRTINFLLQYHHELMDNNKHHIMNARSYTMFANLISGIPDGSNPENLAMILQIASGCFDDPDNIIGNLFTTFIANKLDLLVEPKSILLEDGETLYPKLKSCVYDDEGKYRPAVASILHTRLLNYSDYYLSKKGSDMQIVMGRLREIMHAKEMIFDEDIIFNIIKHLNANYNARMQKYYYDPEIRAKILE